MTWILERLEFNELGWVKLSILGLNSCWIMEVCACSILVLYSCWSSTLCSRRSSSTTMETLHVLVNMEFIVDSLYIFWSTFIIKYSYTVYLCYWHLGCFILFFSACIFPTFGLKHSGFELVLRDTELIQSLVRGFRQMYLIDANPASWGIWVTTKL